MAIDIYGEIRTIFSNFMHGIVSSVDDRDASETSLKNLVGFNLAENRGKSTRDYGTSDHFASIPLPTRNIPVGPNLEAVVAVSQIFGVSAFRIEELGEEFIVLYGSTPYGLPFPPSPPSRPGIWIRRFRGPSMIDGTGTVDVGASSRIVVGQGDTKFAEEIALGEYISITGITKKVTRLLDVPFTESLYVLSAFGGAISDEPFLRQANSTVDQWVELTDVVLTSPFSVGTRLEIDDVTTTAVDEGTFKLYQIASLADINPDNFFAGWIIKDVNTLEVYTIIGSVNVGAVGSRRLQFTIYESTSTLAVATPVELYRYSDSLKLNLPKLGVLGTTWYSDNVSQDRLSFGWQWNAPRKELPLMIDYVKRDFFYDGTVPLVKGRTDQIYFGREIPDYDSLADLGISYTVDFTASDIVYPSADLRTGNWKNQSNGTTNLFQSIKEVTFDPADYVTSDIAKQTYRDFEVQLDDIGVGATGKLRVYVALNVIGTLNGVSSFSNTFSGFLGTPKGTLSMGWKRGATGTITISNITTEVTGDGASLFLQEFAVGDRIVRNSNGETRTVKRIVDDDTLFVDAPFSAAVGTLAYSNIITIGSDLMIGYTSRYHYVEVDIETINTRFGGGTVFASGTRTLTGRVEVDNHGDKAEQFTLRLLQMKIEQPTASAVSFVRFVIVPMFNGYMLGRPMLLNTSVSSASPFTFYLRMAALFPLLDKRLTSLFVFSDYGDDTLNVDQFYSAWEVSLVKNEQNKRGVPWGEVNVWAQETLDNRYYAQDAGLAENAPEAFVNSRIKTDLVQVSDLLGYGIVKDIPTIGANWRYQTKTAIGERTMVVIDESDDVLRLCLFDAEGLMNDHNFPNRTKDNASNPLKLFLGGRGELLGIVGQLGNIYAFKRSAIEIIQASTTASNIISADVAAKKSIIITKFGIVYAGKFGIYVLPSHGGLFETLTTSIRNEYVALSDTDKEAIIATECEDIGVIMFSMPSICYVYHVGMAVWWKRKFALSPVAMTKRSDNSVIFGANDTYPEPPVLLKYPDRASYIDGTSAIPWVIETQWLTLGASDVEKLIRTLLSVTLSDGAMSYVIAIYFDRIGHPTDSLLSLGTPFDSVTVSTVDGISESPLPVKVPNSFRECKIILRYNPTLTAGQSNHPLDLLELKAFGETSVTGLED